MKKEKTADSSAIEKVLKENEIKANKLVSISYLFVGAWLLFLFIIFIAGLAKKDYLKGMGIACGVSTVVLFSLFIVGLTVKWNKPWLKYLLLFSGLICFSVLSLFYGATCVMFMLIPVVLSCRYYLEKLSLSIAILTVALCFACSLISVTCNLFIDFNTVVVVDFDFNPNVTPIKEIISHVDKGSTLINYIVSTTLPVTVVTAVLSTICYVVSKHARLNLIKQTEETEKNARIETELSLATDIQANMLPRVFPAFPNRKEFDIFASMNPAKEVGGDFYDMFMVDDTHLAVVIADVSGKGVPAALFMVVAKTLLNDQALLSLSVENICNIVNKRLCQNNEAGLFVTAWFGVIDLKNGKMQYVNAGHNPPLIIKDGKADFIKTRSGFFFAGRENTKYKPFELTFNKGDKLFLYTDGITEARNVENQMFGNDNLKNCLEQNASLSTTDLAKKVKTTLEEYTVGEEQFDDITMLCFEYKGVDAKEEKEQVFPAEEKSIGLALDFIKQELEKVESSKKTFRQITVCLEEILANICYYAYKGKKGDVTLKFDFGGDRYKITVVDGGVAFNPLEHTDPDITLKPKDRQIGGLGILMVKRIMDKVDYVRYDNQNIFSMEKYIPQKE